MSMKDNTPAMTVEILDHFLYECLDHPEFISGNWGTSYDRNLWNVNDETYINGVMITVDADYYMGYVIEFVDRTSGALGYMAIAVYHGKGRDGSYLHDFVTYEPQCGTFGNRTNAADQSTVARWGVASIYAMFESHDDAQRRT